MRGNRFVIRGHHPVRNVVLVVIGCALGVAAIAVAYWQGGRGSSSQIAALEQAQAEHRLQTQAIERVNRELRERLAQVERSTQVDLEAANATRRNLVDQTAELVELRQAVGVYRSVLGGDNRNNRLRVHSVRALAAVPVAADATHHTVGIEVVLTRFLSAATPLEGTVSVTAVSDSAGAMTISPRAQAEFSLKHIRRVRLELEVPNDFLPSSILVQAAAKERDRTVRAERTLAWDEVGAG